MTLVSGHSRYDSESATLAQSLIPGRLFVLRRARGARPAGALASGRRPACQTPIILHRPCFCLLREQNATRPRRRGTHPATMDGRRCGWDTDRRQPATTHCARGRVVTHDHPLPSTHYRKHGTGAMSEKANRPLLLGPPRAHRLRYLCPHAINGRSGLARWAARDGQKTRGTGKRKTAIGAHPAWDSSESNLDRPTC